MYMKMIVKHFSKHITVNGTYLKEKETNGKQCIKLIVIKMWIENNLLSIIKEREQHWNKKKVWMDINLCTYLASTFISFVNTFMFDWFYQNELRLQDKVILIAKIFSFTCNCWAFYSVTRQQCSNVIQRT